MARKTRRAKPKIKLTWRRLFIYFTPVIVVAFLVFNQANGGNILGVTDSETGEKKGLFNFGIGIQKTRHDSAKKSDAKPSCNRVTSFSAVTICEATSEKTNNSFQSYNYTCEDGTSGSVEQKEGKCVPISKAYELARKACHQKCKPSKSPSKTPTPIPTETIVE